MSETVLRTVDREDIESGLISIVEKMTSRWGRAFHTGIGPETLLGADLGFDSMQLVKLVSRVEKHFKVKRLPFHLLLLDDENVSDDLRIIDVINFVDRVLNES